MRDRSDQRTVVCAALIAAACSVPAAEVRVQPFGADRPVEIAVRFDISSNAYTLTAAGADTVVYTVDLDDPDVAAGMLRVTASVNGRAPRTILAKAGTRYRSVADVVLDPEEAALSAGASLVEPRIDGAAVVLRFREKPASHLLEKIYRLSLSGYSLVVTFSSDATWGLDGYAGVSLGRAGP